VLRAITFNEYLSVHSDTKMEFSSWKFIGIATKKITKDAKMEPPIQELNLLSKVELLEMIFNLAL
jgi:hypothetical protein